MACIQIKNNQSGQFGMEVSQGTWHVCFYINLKLLFRHLRPFGIIEVLNCEKVLFFLSSLTVYWNKSCGFEISV